MEQAIYLLHWKGLICMPLNYLPGLTHFVFFSFFEDLHPLFLGNPQKGRYNFRVKEMATVILEYLNRLLVGSGSLVRALGNNRVKSISNSENSRLYRYLPLLQPVGIARTIVSLVVVAHNRQRIFEKLDMLQQPVPDLRVSAHLVPV